MEYLNKCAMRLSQYHLIYLKVMADNIRQNTGILFPLLMVLYVN